MSTWSFRSEKPPPCLEVGGVTSGSVFFGNAGDSAPSVLKLKEAVFNPPSSSLLRGGSSFCDSFRSLCSLGNADSTYPRC